MSEDVLNSPEYIRREQLRQEEERRREEEERRKKLTPGYVAKDYIRRKAQKKLLQFLIRQGIFTAIRAAAISPYVWVPLLVGLGIIIFIFFFSGVFGGGTGTALGPDDSAGTIITPPAGGSAGGDTVIPIPITPGVIPPYPSNIPAALKSQFNITINGFGLTHQQYLWDLIWENTNTKFPQLLNGLVVQATPPGGISYQASCGSPGVYLGQYSGPTFFKFIATHEFGHWLEACNTGAEIKRQDAINAFYAEGGISWYATNGNPTCFTDTTNWKENYADIVAYFLHPNAGFSSGPRKCVPPSLQNPPNPFFGGPTQFPVQLGIARSILLP